MAFPQCFSVHGDPHSEGELRALCRSFLFVSQCLPPAFGWVPRQLLCKAPNVAHVRRCSPRCVL